MIIGIDPGRTGGIALLSSPYRCERLEIMPLVNAELDHRALNHMLIEMQDLAVDNGVSKNLKCRIEKVGAMPGQGSVSMFSFGMSYGAVIQAVACLGIPYELVTPQHWQRVALKGTKMPRAGLSTSQRKKATKDRSKQAAIRLFPNENFLATDKSRVPHGGLVDAVLIAYSGF